MNTNDVIMFSYDLMSISDAVYLTTIDSTGLPQTRAMLNLWNSRQYAGLVNLLKKDQDEFVAYFTTNTSSAKIRQINANPRVSTYYCKPQEWRGLMLAGNIEIVTNKELKKSIWQDNWILYYPKGVDDPDYTILRLKPSILKLYHKLDSHTVNLG